MNKIFIDGIICKPETRQAGDKKIFNCRLAVYAGKDKDGNPYSEFYTVERWLTDWDTIQNAPEKSRAIVEGRLVTDRWTKDGQERTTVKIVADSIALMAPREQHSQAPRQNAPEATPSKTAQQPLYEKADNMGKAADDEFPF